MLRSCRDAPDFPTTRLSLYTCEVVPPEIQTVSPGWTEAHWMLAKFVQALGQFVPALAEVLRALSTYQLLLRAEKGKRAKLTKHRPISLLVTKIIFIFLVLAL